MDNFRKFSPAVRGMCAMLEKMGSLMNGLGAAFGFGFAYFVVAIPSGVALGLPVAMAAAVAWLGYSAGGAVMVVAGEPARKWLVAKLRIPTERDSTKWVWRLWDRAGLAGLALLAPVTVGPQAGAVLALVIGEPGWKVATFFSLGVIPWCVLFGILTAMGVHIAK